MSINIRTLPPALAEKARKELNEDPKRLVEDLEHIKGWIAKQPHLRARTDDQWLVTFLRGCKYSLERTKEKLDLYYTIRSTAPELFRVKHTDPIFEEVLNMGPVYTNRLNAGHIMDHLLIMKRVIRPPLTNKIYSDTGQVRVHMSPRTVSPQTCRRLLTGNLQYAHDFKDTKMHAWYRSILILPKTAGPDSPRVTLVRPGKYDPDKYNLTDIWSIMGIITKIILMDDDHTVVAGSVNIMDMEGVTMSHFLQMTPANMKKMSVLVQDASPMRMKSGHYLNTPPGFETIFNAMKTFLNEKNRSRLHVHNKNYEALYKHVPKDILPAEYGGNGGTEQEIIEYWKRKVKEYSAFLEEDTQYRTDESKRPGKPRTAEDMFGAEGSFRKLEFD